MTTQHEERLSAEGVDLLSYWRLDSTERGHAQRVLEILNLPEGSRVIDLGAGTGQLARLCNELRPDLHWTLVNVNEWQLERAPHWAQHVVADMASTGLPGDSFDAAIIEYSLGYCNPAAALEEARRLLRTAGLLVLHELYAAQHEVQATASEYLNYRLAGFDEVRLWANVVGLDLVGVHEDLYRAPGESVESAWAVFRQFDHNLSVYRRADRPHAFWGRRVALQFSGGKDSLACLYLLRPFVERGLPVYWTHTGDTIPESVRVIEAVRQWVPDFRVIQADVMGWKKVHGIPSDITTAQASWIGQQYAMSDTKLIGRFDCCWANLMEPMHLRMLADEIDMVVRGTKLADTGQVPDVSQCTEYQVVLPLEHWSHADVFEYLELVGAPRSDVYDHFKSISAPECTHCSAWWDDGKAAYLKALHPEKVAQYRISLDSIRVELARRMLELENELKECAT